MVKFSPLVVAPPLLFAGLAALFYTGLGREDADALDSVRENAPAPQIALTPLGDKTPFEDADLRSGGPKIVNYWASWCAPCRVEHPQLVDLAAEGVPIFGINFKDDSAKALRFLEELGDPYTAVSADAEGRVALDWGVYGVPETYVVDGDGTIILRFAGPITEKILDDIIRPALTKATINTDP
jgi:cytochrome c biogenesis protein CcmG/thiol:disulfide interchange protein DsbE